MASLPCRSATNDCAAANPWAARVATVSDHEPALARFRIQRTDEHVVGRANDFKAVNDEFAIVPQ